MTLKENISYLESLREDFYRMKQMVSSRDSVNIAIIKKDPEKVRAIDSFYQMFDDRLRSGASKIIYFGKVDPKDITEDDIRTLVSKKKMATPVGELIKKEIVLFDEYRTILKEFKNYKTAAQEFEELQKQQNVK